MNDSDTTQGEKERLKGKGQADPGIYQIFETGILGTAFSIIYAFGILRFAAALTQIWGKAIAVGFSVFAIVIAIAFLHSLIRIIEKSKSKDFNEV